MFMSEYICVELQNLILKEISKDCQKMQTEGDGCFECRYSKEGTEDCCIREPYKWDLSELKED